MTYKGRIATPFRSLNKQKNIPEIYLIRPTAGWSENLLRD